MKPSEILEKVDITSYEQRHHKILDEMAEDITRLKEINDNREFGNSQYTFSNFIKREWDTNPKSNKPRNHRLYEQGEDKEIVCECGDKVDTFIKDGYKIPIGHNVIPLTKIHNKLYEQYIVGIYTQDHAFIFQKRGAVEQCILTPYEVLQLSQELKEWAELEIKFLKENI